MSWLLTILSFLLLAIATSFILAIPLISLLYRFGVTRRGEADFSNLIEKRKLKIGVPVMGGLIIVITVVLLNTLLNMSENVMIVLTIFTLSAILGGVDDLLNIYGHKRRIRTLQKINTLIKVHANYLVRIRLILSYPWYMYSRFFFMLGSNPGKGIHAHEKIIVQFISGLILALWLWSHLGYNGTVWVPFIELIQLGILYIPFVIITVLLMTNAVNIADGLDGLSTSQLASSIIGFLAIALIQQKSDLVILLTIVLGALGGYFYFNIPPARVQMGDVGALALGTLLAAVAFLLDVPILLLVISLPFAVTLGSTVIQGIGRRILGRRIFKMAPLHHHFELVGWSEEKVVMRFALFGIFSMLLGLWIYLLGVDQLCQQRHAYEMTIQKPTVYRAECKNYYYKLLI